MAIEVSQTARCDWLALMAESDARGRICPDPNQLLQQIAQFRQLAEEAQCTRGAYAFASDQERFHFFHDPHQVAHAIDHSCEVTLMCGLPGAGKDYWIRKHGGQQEVISLDALRIGMGIAPADPQGTVLQRARDIALDYMRAGQPFIWNASNLSRHARIDCARFFHEHRARVRIVYIEASPERLFAQNRQRRRKVPMSVIERLLDRWEVPDPTEAHQVDWIVDL